MGMIKLLKRLWWRHRIRASMKTLGEMDRALLKANSQKRQAFWRDYIKSPSLRADLFRHYPEILFTREEKK